MTPKDIIEVPQTSCHKTNQISPSNGLTAINQKNNSDILLSEYMSRVSKRFIPKSSDRASCRLSPKYTPQALQTNELQNIPATFK
jgi:hypothetical protein